MATRPMAKDLLISVSFLFLACGSEQPSIDSSKLSALRQALPNQNMLSVDVPESANVPVPMKVGDPAEYPRDVGPVANEINTVIKSLLDQIDIITDIPPTLYDSEKMEFVWGPFDDDQSEIQGDTVYLWARDNGEDTKEDFRFVYALVRGMGRDMAKNTPVIWGATNPDPDNEDFGNGVVLFDMEANFEFEEANNPNHGDLDRGRFAAAYFKGLDKDNQDNVLTLVVGAFRNFVSKEDAEQANLLDADYFWGNVKAPEETYDFLNFRLVTDLDEEGGTQAENMSILMAFYNNGVGRAEVGAFGGDIPDDSRVESVECWNSLIMREYFTLELISQNGSRTQIKPTEGVPENCAMTSLDSIPSLEDVPSDIMAALSQVAENGVPQEE